MRIIVLYAQKRALITDTSRMSTYHNRVLAQMGVNRMKGLGWGILLGSILMTLSFGLYPIWSEYGFPFPGPLGLFLGLVVPVIAGVVAGAMAGGSRGKRVLAGVLCAIPAIIVYWYLMRVAGIGDGLIPPVMFFYMAGFGAIGGLISSLRIPRRRRHP